jgi:hypothetical protein
MGLSELFHNYHGWGAQGADGKASGPFAYAGSEQNAAGDTHGYSAGFGLLSGPLGGGARADVASARAHLGGWRDESGKTNYGIEGDAALARFGIERGGALGPIGFDVGVGTANAGAKINEETASIGAQANIIEGSVSAGTDEHNARFGMSLGVGLAGRAHYGDADGDGVRELGFGADFGPFSFDVKSELLGHAWNGISAAGSAIGGAASSAWNAVTDW